MKRHLIVTAIVIGLSLLLTGANAKTKTKKEGGKSAVKCPLQKTLKKQGIEGCPDTGCGGSLDPLLNQQKNTKDGDPDTARNMTFADFAGIPNDIEGYKGIGFPRDKVRDQGEGDMVRVVAWALASRPQKTSGKDKNGKPKKGESCNCGFTGKTDPQNTDVHIVLVDDAALELKANAGNGKSAAVNTLKKREAQSQTVEYTPRVRVARGEEFDGRKLKSLIGPPGGALKVRVTGLLLYDSEHALGPFKLTRKTDWEIHPVVRLEYCPKNKACADKGTANWVDINK